MTDAYLYVGNCQFSKKSETERFGEVPNKASDFPYALGTHLYLLIQANLSGKFSKLTN
jgi:hypothetical protein